MATITLAEARENLAWWVKAKDKPLAKLKHNPTYKALAERVALLEAEAR